jgi:hypothetical protein
MCDIFIEKFKIKFLKKVSGKQTNRMNSYSAYFILNLSAQHSLRTHSPNHFFLQKPFCNLHRIGSSAFAQIIAYNPTV